MAGDVVQGGLGNCWFLGAISVISTRLELIDHLFAYCAPKKGLYKVRFYTEGYWHVITVDDRIPCSSAGVPVYASLARIGCLGVVWCGVEWGLFHPVWQWKKPRFGNDLQYCARVCLFPSMPPPHLPLFLLF